MQYKVVGDGDFKVWCTVWNSTMVLYEILEWEVEYETPGTISGEGSIDYGDYETYSVSSVSKAEQYEWSAESFGGGYLDSGYGNFDYTTEWVVWGNNTISLDGGALKIEYVDNLNGAFANFSDTYGHTLENLVVGKEYTVGLKIKVDAGDNIRMKVWDGSDWWESAYIYSTDYVWVTHTFEAQHATDSRLQVRFPVTDPGICWIDEYYLIDADTITTTPSLSRTFYYPINLKVRSGAGGYFGDYSPLKSIGFSE